MDYMPAYLRIAEDIQQGIAQGVYKPDEQIPTQAQLSGHYQVSRITVRDAVNELMHRGLLYTRQGKGTFVASTKRNPYPAVRTGSFSAGNRTAGTAVATKVVSLERIEAPFQIAKALGIEEGSPLICLSRVRSINGEKTIFNRSHLSARRFCMINFLEEDFEKQSLYETLSEKSGLRISATREEFRAICCPGNVASLLDYSPGEPMIYVIRCTFDDQGACFEWSEQYERTDHYPIRVKSGAKT